MKVVRSVSRWRDNDGKPATTTSLGTPSPKSLGRYLRSPYPSRHRSGINLAYRHSDTRWPATRSRAVRYASSSQAMTLPIGPRRAEPCLTAQRLCSATKAGPETIGPEPQTVLDHNWLKELIHSTAADFGRKTGRDVAEIFRARATDVFASQFGGLSTSLLRPTIEEHEQNHEWRGPYNRFVEGLRDSILGWLEVDPDVARPYVEDLLISASKDLNVSRSIF